MKKIKVEIANLQYELMCDENNQESLLELCDKVNNRLLNIKSTLNKNIDNHYLLLLAALKMQEDLDHKTEPESSTHEKETHENIIKSKTIVQSLIQNFKSDLK